MGTPVLEPKEVLAKSPMILCESEPGDILETVKHGSVIHVLLINYWLVKQEPSGPRAYNFETMKKDGTTVWDGVHNNLALKHMNNMKKNDLAFFYHTGDERRIMGVIKIISKPYPNPEEDNDRFVIVDVKYQMSLKRPVTLDEIKKEKRFRSWDLLRISRLSVMPVPKDIWDLIIQMSQN